MGERYIRVVMAVATATQNQKRNASGCHLCDLGKGYLSLSLCTELWLHGSEGLQRAALRIIAEKGRADSGVDREWKE